MPLHYLYKIVRVWARSLSEADISAARMTIRCPLKSDLDCNIHYLSCHRQIPDFIAQDKADPVEKLARNFDNCLCFRCAQAHFIESSCQSRVFTHRGPGALNEQISQMPVAAPGQIARRLFISTGAAIWGYSHVACEPVEILEPVNVADFSQKDHGINGAYTRNGSQQLYRFSVSLRVGQGQDIPVESGYQLTQIDQLGKMDFKRNIDAFAV